MMTTFAKAVFTLAVNLVATTGPAHHELMSRPMDHEQPPAHVHHADEVKRRGALAMGFDQETTAHHFRITDDGGVIEVEVKNATDATGRSQVRAHLKQIAQEFARGDFDKPHATHGEMPPGVRTMERRKRAINYEYEDTDKGGRIIITTSDSKARHAVHEFLRYQIREHKTGDPTNREG